MLHSEPTDDRAPRTWGWIDRGGYEIAHMEADPTHVGHRNKNARITDDVFGVLAGEKEGFTNKAEGEISYVPVADANRVLGYLWWSDEENAAGFRPRPAAGPPAFNAASLWTKGLSKKEHKGLSPSQVVAELIPHHGGSVAGRAHQDPPLQAANLAALTEIAQR